METNETLWTLADFRLALADSTGRKISPQLADSFSHRSDFPAPVLVVGEHRPARVWRKRDIKAWIRKFE